MKKIVLVLVLGLLIQAPVRVLASGPPPPPPKSDSSETSPVVILGAAVAMGALLFFEGGSKDSAKKTGNEFADLNNNGSFKTLLNQVAGGSLNTLDILK